MNELIQWICVGVVLCVVAVGVVRHVAATVRWSRRMKGGGNAALPPCCGGKSGGKGDGAGGMSRREDCAAENKASRGLGASGRDKVDSAGGCAGCGADCPLAGTGKNQKL